MVEAENSGPLLPFDRLPFGQMLDAYSRATIAGRIGSAGNGKAWRNGDLSLIHLSREIDGWNTCNMWFPYAKVKKA